jgi:dipeptidyl aminopeptidase/acylaminoacyl peptidase
MIFGMKYSPDSKYLGMYLNTPQTPGDVFSIDLTSKELVRWTTSETGGLKSKDFIAPTLIHYPTFDTIESKPRMIPSFYYKPRKTGPFPVLIKIHGGPEGQAKPFFNPQTQYILNELGIAVLVPNVRGSAGYGKSYLQLDNGYKREDTISDIGRLLDWIDRQPELDGNRVALIGGSYGGYMVLASMTHFNHRLKGGIEIVGISNFVTFLKNTRDYRRDLRRQEYGDERDPKMRKFLERISPTSNARKITKPILVAQGYNDPRVPVTESEQMVKVIRENGGKVWYILAKNEGHGFSKKTNRDYYNSAVMLFLEKVLLSGKTVEDRTGD